MVLPSVVCIFKYKHLGGGKTGWGPTSGHKSMTLSVAGLFPLLTLWMTAWVWLHELSDDDDENDNNEGQRQFKCLTTALVASAIAKVLSALAHPKMQWWYWHNGKMGFTKRAIRSAADVYLVIVSGWEMIGKASEVTRSTDTLSSFLRHLLPFHGTGVVALWGTLILLEDLRRFMKDHDEAEEQFYDKKYSRGRDPGYLRSKGYITCINEGAVDTRVDRALDLDLGEEKKKSLLKYVTLNNLVTLVQLWIAALTEDGMVWMSCLIKMSANSELEHDAYIEDDDDEDDPTFAETLLGTAEAK